MKFFIVGMPRSGTTLISEQLSAKTNVVLIEESHILDYWAAKLRKARTVRETNSVLMSFFEGDFMSGQYENFDPVRKKLCDRASAVDWYTLMQSLSEHLAQTNTSSIVGERTPGNYRYINKISNAFPEAKFIWILRDPRAIAASYRHVPWAHAWCPSAIGGSWRRMVNRHSEALKNKHILTLKYEDFVRAPDAELNRILEFLSARKIGHRENSAVRRYEVNKFGNWWQDHLSAAKKPVDDSSVLKWTKELAKGEIAAVESLCYREMLGLGYNPITEISVGMRLEHNMRYYQNMVKSRLKRSRLPLNFR